MIPLLFADLDWEIQTLHLLVGYFFSFIVFALVCSFMLIDTLYHIQIHDTLDWVSAVLIYVEVRYLVSFLNILLLYSVYITVCTFLSGIQSIHSLNFLHPNFLTCSLQNYLIRKKVLKLSVLTFHLCINLVFIVPNGPT